MSDFNVAASIKSDDDDMTAEPRVDFKNETGNSVDC